MTRWIYAKNNAYDLVAKIENGKARVLTSTPDFPNTNDADLTETEILDAVERFMKDVINNDYSDEWEEYDEEEILEGNDIIWEKTYIDYQEAERMIIEDEETSNEFETWLKDNRDKGAHEWDSDDLGEFFRFKGYETL